MRTKNKNTSSRLSVILAVLLIVGAGFGYGQSFTVTGGSVVTDYWNSTNTGGTASFTATANPVDYVKVKISVDGGGYVEITGGGDNISTGISKDIDVTAANIESAGTLSDGESFHIYAVFTSTGAPVDTIKLTASPITVDQTLPSSFQVSTVSAVGGNVVTNKWNSSNTTLDVDVPIGNDNSLLSGGEVQLRGKIGSNPYENLGAASAISLINTTKTINIAAATVEALGGFSDGQTLYLRAVITDHAGNETTGDASSSELIIDQTAPQVISITGTPASGTLKAGATTNITITFDEDVRLSSGNLELTLNTGAVLEIPAVDLDNNNSAIIAYQVQTDEEANDLNVTGLALSGGNTLRDAAGNDYDDSLPAGNNLADNTNLDVDGVSPLISSITSSPGTADLGVGQEIDITVNFDEAVTLSGGNLLVELETGTVDRTVTISSISGATSGTGTYTVQEDDESSDLTVNSVSLSGGTLQDAAGNDADISSIPGGQNLADNSAIVVDGISPDDVNLAGGAGTIIAAGGTVVADYWNNTNTSLEVTVPIAADASLLGGSVQIQGFWGTFDGAQNLGNAASINATGTNKTVSIPAGTLEAFGGFAEDEVLKILAIVTDASGNTSGVGTQSDDEITIDQTAPGLLSITSTTPDGYAIPADDVNVTVTFDEAVTLAGGNFQIELETGATDRTVSIGTISASTTASGTYTVQEDDVSSDLNANSVSLSSGTLRDAAGNDYNSSLPAGNNLANNSNLVVDGVVPTITSISSTSSDDDYGVGDDVNVTVTFSEEVTLSGGNLQIELETGAVDRTVTISSVSNSTTASGTYTVQADDANSDLSVNGPLTLSAGSLQDAAGNDVDLTLPSGNNLSDNNDIDVDGVAPDAVNLAAGAGTVAATGGTEVSAYWNSTNTALDVTVPIASDATLVGGTVQIKGYWGVVGGAQDLGSAQTISATGTNKTVSIDAATLEAFGGFAEEAVLKIVAIVTDVAGNSSDVGTESDDETTIDQTQPSITNISSTTPDGYLVPADDVNITLTFSEAVTLAGGNVEIELETGDTDQTAIIGTISSATSASGTYTVQTDDVSSDLNVKSVTLSAGSLRDAAGNGYDTALPSGNNLADNSNLVVDGVIPTITSITSTSADDTYGVGDDINVTVTFSEDVTLAGGNLQIELETGATDRTVTITSITSSTEATGTYTVQEDDEASDLAVNGPLTLSAGSLQDAAGNDVDLSVSTNISDGSDIVVDGVTPDAVDLAGGAGTVVATGGTEVADYWNSTNTALEVTVPIAADASLLNGTVQLRGYWGVVGGAQDLGNAQTITATGTDKTITVQANVFEGFNGYDEGEVLKIVAVVTDAAGNTSTVGTESDDEITVDTVSPTMTQITSSPSTGYAIPTDVITLTVTFDEAVTLSGGDFEIELETGTTDRTVSIGAINNSTTAAGDYTVQEGDASSDLNVNSVNVPIGNLRDQAGNEYDSTLPVGENLADNSDIVIDGEAPTIVSITSTTDNSTPLPIDSTVTLTVTFSEAVTLAGGNLRITLETGTTDRVVTITSISNSLTTTGIYTVQADDEADPLTVNGPLTLSAGTLQDAAGNNADLSIPGGGNLDDDTEFEIDGVLPDAFAVGTVVTVGDPVVADYWNSSNTGMTISVPIANDASLQGGTIQIRGYYGDISGAQDIGTATNITGVMLGTTQDISITTANISSSVGFTEDQTLKITAELSDEAGNMTVGTTSSDDFHIDETQPELASITSDPTAGTYKENDVIDVTITFTENVALADGDLETTLETGDVLTTATVDLDGSSNTVTESYTVGADDESSDLAVTTLGLTAGTLRDLAGNDALLGTPPVGTNLSDNSNLVIDGAIPTITHIRASGEDGGYFGIGDTVTITAKFSENVTISGGNSLVVTLDVGQSALLTDFTDVDSAQGIYVVQEGDNSNFLYATGVSLSAGTLQDGAGNDVPMDISSAENIDDVKTIYIDGTYPDAFTTGDLSTLGEPVVATYWNSSNTAFRVPIPNPGTDASLNGGFAFVEARMDANAFTAIGDTIDLVLNPDTINVTREQLEDLVTGLPGYFAGDVIEARGVIVDIAGNSRDGSPSAVTLKSDQDNPTQTATSGIMSSGISASQGYINLTDTSVTVQTPLDADNSLLNGSFQLQARIGLAGAWSNIGPDSTIQTVNTTMETVLEAWSTFETWGANDGDDLFYRAVVTDVSGNVTTGTTGDISVHVDRTLPADFTVGNVDASGGTVVEGYFNSTNLGATVTVPIDPADNTLIGGYVQLRSIIDTDTTAILDSLDIDALTDLIFSPTRAVLEGLGFGEGDTIKFDAVITDVAGNSTIGTVSDEFLKIDESLPVVDANPSVLILGTDVSQSYWNSTSTGIQFKAEIVQSDPSLVGGRISVAADLVPSGDTVFETFATTVRIAALGEDSVDVIIPAAEIEALEGGTGFADGLEIEFQLTIADTAGNAASSSTLSTTFTVDQTAPIGGSFVADGTTTDPFINDLDTLMAEWSGFTDPVSDIEFYEYSVGSSDVTDDLVPWTLADTTLMDTLYAYIHEAEYFINVRAVDSARNVSDLISTDVITADLALPSTTSDILPYYYIGDWDEEYSFGGTAVDALSGPDSLTLQLVRISDGANWDGDTWVDQDTVLQDKLGDSDWFGKPTTRTLASNGWGFYMPADSLDNREDYTVSLFALDSAGNWQTSADEHTFQFVINTAPEFADMEDTLDVDEDTLFDYEIIATDVDLGTISGDTLYYTILVGPDSLEIDSLTGIFDWTPENADVDTHAVTVKVHDTFDESDTTSFVLLVNQVNDAPEPVTLLLPADSTQLTAADSLLLTFTWTTAFDIEGDTLTYEIFMEGSGGYDTSIVVPDTTVSLDVSEMDFPTLNPVQWFVRASDATDASLPSDTFHVTTSAPEIALSSVQIDADMVRYTSMDTMLTLSNSGLTDLRWEEHASPAWVDLDTTNGRIEWGDSVDFVFTIDLDGLTVGSYLDSILLTTNDPEQDTVSIQVFVQAFDKPRPVLAFYKNPAYPGQYNLMIVDSLGMTDSLAIEFADSNLTITEIDTFSYLANIELSSEGLKTFEIFASNWVGDTTVTAGLTSSLARSGVPWIAQSPDAQFQISGTAKSIHATSQVVILDSVLSSVEGAQYRVLGDNVQVAEPVMVSMPAEKRDQAIYARTEDGYRELPTISKDGRIYAWSDGFGSYKRGPMHIIVPEQSTLSQNYPNPFNPSTTIEYDIGFTDGLSQQVVFEVYNIRGQVVRTLVDQRMQPGRYSVVWNALDNYGRPVSSGIYLARMMTDGGYMKTVKMLVLR